VKQVRFELDAASPLDALTRDWCIARLAASSPPAETQKKIGGAPEYFLLPVKSILNRCDSNRVPFEWTINPIEDASLPASIAMRATPRIHGAGRVRVREKDLCEEGCRAFAGA